MQQVCGLRFLFPKKRIHIQLCGNGHPICLVASMLCCTKGESSNNMHVKYIVSLTGPFVTSPMWTAGESAVSSRHAGSRFQALYWPLPAGIVHTTQHQLLWALFQYIFSKQEQFNLIKRWSIEDFDCEQQNTAEYGDVFVHTKGNCWLHIR